MEKGPQLEVSIKTLLKPGIDPEIPCLEGQFIPYTTAAPEILRYELVHSA